MVGQELEAACASAGMVVVRVWVVVIMRAVGYAREIVLVSSTREMRVDVWVVADCGPSQGGTDPKTMVGRWAMWGLRKW